MPETEHRTLKILLLLGVFSPLLWQGYGRLNRYLEDAETQLFAIDIPTGQVKWRTTLPNAQDRFYSAPILLSSDRILITQFPYRSAVNRQCSWIEFDRQSGKIIENYDAKKLGLPGCPAPRIPPVAQDGKLYTFWRNSINEGERSEQGIAAIDFKTRQIQWNLPIQLRWRDASSEKTLVMADGKLIAGISDDNQSQYGTLIKALDPTTGNLLWQAQHDGHLGYLSSTFNPNQFVLYDKSIIFWTNAKLKRRWLGHHLDTGKPTAVYADNAQPSSQNISEIFQKDGQLYAVTEREESPKVISRSITQIKLAKGVFALERSSPNLSVDSICPKLSNLYPIRQAVIASCEQNDINKNFVVAIDSKTYKPKWRIALGSLSEVISNPTSDRTFIVNSNEIQAVSNDDGKVQWSLYGTARGVTIEDDTLFVAIYVPRKNLWNFNPFKPNQS
jgi:outer membrane protein assembly factor BamB